MADNHFRADEDGDGAQAAQQDADLHASRHRYLLLYGKSLLKGVSRSFYLTIRALPGLLREPISLGYLLARASDTMADAGAIPLGDRLQLLELFADALEQGGGEKVGWLAFKAAAAAEAQVNKHERHLLLALPEIFAWLEAQEKPVRAELRRTLATIVKGQQLDLKRFGYAGPGSTVIALEDAGQLDEYTYLVAGRVGELWTRLCAYFFTRWCQTSVHTMLDWGRNFGKALQLTNILRDLPADLRDGRCYLPMTELAHHFGGRENVDLTALAADPSLARSVWENWLTRAQDYLQDAVQYTLSCSRWRLRFACALPVLIGLRTLQKLRTASPAQFAAGTKISRQEVRRLLLRTFLASFRQKSLSRLFQDELKP